MAFYVINLPKKHCCHEGSKAYCEEYVENATAAFNAGPFEIVEGAKALRQRVKEIGGRV